MKEKKNIDRLFQEKFKDFEKTPPKNVWVRIKHELTDKKGRGAVLPLWSKIAAVAALLALVFILGKSRFFTKQETSVVKSSEEMNRTEQPAKKSVSPKNVSPAMEKEEYVKSSEFPEQKTDAIEKIRQRKTASEISVGHSVRYEDDYSSQTDNARSTVRNNSDSKGEETLVKTSEDQALPENEATEGLVKKTTKTDSAAIATTQTSNEIEHKIDELHQDIAGVDGSKGQVSSEKSTAKKDSVIAHENSISDQYSAEIAQHKNEEFISDTIDENQKNKKSIFDAIAQKEKKENKEELDVDDPETGTSKIAIRPNVAPIYYSSMNGGSAVDPKFADNKAQGEVTMSYGIDISYAVSDRIRIRSGINKVNMSYNTKGIAFTSSSQASSLAGLSTSPKSSNISVVQNMPKNEGRPQEVDGGAVVPYIGGELNQQFEYLEVPLEIEYRLLDERFSINLIGGASTLILSKDLIQINSRMGRTDLGKASNLNSMSFTTNFGVGFGYNLTKELNLNVEPTFKYQLNGFSSGASEFKPYYLGVYTGLRFTF